ncbi:MAG: hypothetical protein ACODAB_08235 [Gemmatimonadota bacterium]
MTILQSSANAGPRAISPLIASGKLSPERLVGDTIGLEDTNDVLASMASYDTVAMPVITRF